MADHKQYEQSGVGPNVELGKNGPRVKNNSGVIEHKDNADSAFAVTRGAAGVADNDYVTLRQLRTGASVDVTGQIDGGSPPTPGDGVVYICTTAGGGFVLKSLYYREGAAWTLIPHVEGRVMRVTDPLTGGTDEYLADHLYMWDADGATWLDIGPAIETAMLKTKRLSIDYTDVGNNNLGSALPSNAIVTEVMVNVTQAFDGSGPLLKVGDGTDDDRHMTTAGVDLETVGLYVARQHYLYGAGGQVVANLAAAAATQGQAELLLTYSIV